MAPEDKGMLDWSVLAIDAQRWTHCTLVIDLLLLSDISGVL